MEPLPAFWQLPDVRTVANKSPKIDSAVTQKSSRAPPVENSIPEIKILRTVRHEDARGFFTEIYNRQRLLELGIDDEFVQDNLSHSVEKGTVRGLHFQSPPYAQAKLVRVVQGSIFDVAVDLRRNSPTFGKHVGVTLTDSDCRQIYVPVGFAHGFMTLEPATEVAYKVSGFYAPSHDGGLQWNDPELGIDWPCIGKEPVLSKKDAELPPLSCLTSPFAYE